MTRLSISTLLILAILFCFSCEEEQKKAELPANKTSADSLSLSAEEVIVNTREEADSISGLEMFEMDTITREEFEKTAAAYKNPFSADTTLFPKKNGAINLTLKDGKTIAFKDHYNKNDETDVTYYLYRGHYSDRLYYIIAGYYEDMNGLLIQSNGKIDTLYYSNGPKMSSDGEKFHCMYTEFTAIDNLGFYYFEYKNGAYQKKAKLQFKTSLIDKITWHNSDAIYCKVYSYKDADSANKLFIYLRFKLK